MKLGIIGRGRWGDVYARTLTEMGVEFWQAGKDWKDKMDDLTDGIIIASEPRSHYSIASLLISRGMPCLIEKPICLDSASAEKLLKLAKKKSAVVFTGHTHLYSPFWREFKASMSGKEIKRIDSWAGGECKLPVIWDWGPHDVSMCIDLIGEIPMSAVWDGKVLTMRWIGCEANLHLSSTYVPRCLEVNSGEAAYTAPLTKPTPIEVLLTEFYEACETSFHDIRGLELGVQVVNVIESALPQYGKVAHGS